jgi:hypothetical protein
MSVELAPLAPVVYNDEVRHRRASRTRTRHAATVMRSTPHPCSPCAAPRPAALQEELIRVKQEKRRCLHNLLAAEDRIRPPRPRVPFPAHKRQQLPQYPNIGLRRTWANGTREWYPDVRGWRESQWLARTPTDAKREHWRAVEEHAATLPDLKAQRDHAKKGVADAKLMEAKVKAVEIQAINLHRKRERITKERLEKAARLRQWKKDLETKAEALKQKTVRPWCWAVVVLRCRRACRCQGLCVLRVESLVRGAQCQCRASRMLQLVAADSRLQPSPPPIHRPYLSRFNLHA